jgi:hypothetical protein
MPGEGPAASTLSMAGLHVLLALVDGPRHGYAIMQTVAAESSGTPAHGGSPHRWSLAAYRAIMRLCPRAVRDRWAGEAVLLLPDLSRQQPSRTAAGHGLAAGALLSIATAAGNPGQMWNTAVGSTSCFPRHDTT